MLTGSTASMAVLRYVEGAEPRPGDHAEPAAVLADEVADHLQLAVVEQPRVDVAEEDDVVLHQLLHRLGEAA